LNSNNTGTTTTTTTTAAAAAAAAATNNISYVLVLDLVLSLFRLHSLLLLVTVL
jgi:hypothetical protein